MAESSQYNVSVLIKAQNELSGQLSKIKKEMADMKQSAKTATSEMSGGFSNIKNTLLGLGIGTGIVSLGKGIITLAGNLEQAKISFTTMLGSAEASTKMLKDLSDFASKTPFTLTGIRDTAKQLMAFGISASDMIPTLKMLGDASSALSVPIQRIAYAYGQVKVAGRLMGQDLMQFTNAGVPLVAELAKNMGVAQSKIKDMVSAGKIGFKDVEKAFQTMTGQGGIFANMMEAQSKTLQGQLSNLEDSVNSLGETIGTIFLPELRKIVSSVIPVTKSIGEFASSNKTLTLALVGIVAVVTAVGVAISVLGGAITLIIASVAMLAIGVGGTVSSFQKMTSTIQRYKAGLQDANGNLTKLGKEFAQAEAGGKKMRDAIADNNVVIEAMAKLNVDQSGTRAEFDKTKKTAIAAAEANLKYAMSFLAIQQTTSSFGKIKGVGGGFGDITAISTKGAEINVANEKKKLNEIMNMKFTGLGASGGASSGGGSKTKDINEQKKALTELIKVMKEEGYTSKYVSDVVSYNRKASTDTIEELSTYYKSLKNTVQTTYNSINDKIKESIEKVMNYQVAIKDLKKSLDDLAGDKTKSIATEYTKIKDDIKSIVDEINSGKLTTDEYLVKVKEQKKLQEALASAYVGLSEEEKKQMDEAIRKQTEYNSLNSIQKIQADYKAKAEAIQKEIEDKNALMAVEQANTNTLVREREAYEKRWMDMLKIDHKEQIKMYDDLLGKAKELGLVKTGSTVTKTTGATTTAGGTAGTTTTTNTPSKNTITKTVYDSLLSQMIKAGKKEADLVAMMKEKGITISGKATGGPVYGDTPYMVGEKGPELFVPSRNGTIVPNNKLGGGQTININMGGVIVREEADIQKIAKELARQIELKRTFNIS